MKNESRFAVALVLLLTTVTVFPQSEPNCGCEDKPTLDVLAIVNGIKITKRDLTPNVTSQVNLLQDTVIEARSQALGLQINSILLEAAASKRGVNPVKLLQLEVIAKVAQPTEAEAQVFYEQHKARIPQSFKDAKNDIIKHLRGQRETDRSAEFSKELRAAASLQVPAVAVTPPANEGERSRLFATVNEVKITSGDIEDSLLPLIFKVQQQVYAYRKADLDLKINDLLLDAEAKRQGLPQLALIDKEVRTKLPIITESQVQQFYKEHKNRLIGEYSALKGQIVDYLLQQEQQKLTWAFAEQLRSKAALQIFLTAPESPVYKIATDNQPTRGNPDGNVTVVQFTDFECPTCAKHYPMFEKLVAEFGGQVKFVVRDYPLSQHANAIKAAEAAEVAREQGKYWEYVAQLYAHQSALEVDKLKDYAAAVGLDRAKFASVLDSGRANDQIQRDLADGARLGLDSSPVFFVNGRRISDYSYEALKAAIQSALNVR